MKLYAYVNCEIKTNENRSVLILRASIGVWPTTLGYERTFICSKLTAFYQILAQRVATVKESLI